MAYLEKPSRWWSPSGTIPVHIRAVSNWFTFPIFDLIFNSTRHLDTSAPQERSQFWDRSQVLFLQDAGHRTSWKTFYVRLVTVDVNVLRLYMQNCQNGIYDAEL